MASAAERKSRSRERAKSEGLCITCCVREPENGRAVCSRCRGSAYQRKLRRNQHLREQAEFQRLLQSHERAGDEASEQHFYHDAIRHFEAALKHPELENADRLRIGQKLVTVAHVTGESKFASSWTTLMLGDSLGANATKEQTIEVLIKTSMYRRRDCQTKTSPPLLAQALQLIDPDGDPVQFKRVNLEMVQMLVELGSYHEAEKFIRAAREAAAESAMSQFALFVEGRYLTSCGKANEALASFEEALHKTEESPRGRYNAVAILSDYAYSALALGNIELAKSCYERACANAHEHQISWFVPLAFLGRADVMLRSGQFKLAHKLLKEAIASNVQVPQVTVKTAYVGIPIALRLNDRELLQQCAFPSAIDFAFQSGEDLLIGRTAASFARLFVAQGRQREAQALVHRALGAVRTLALHWELAIEVASIGVDADVRHARKLLEERTALQAAEVPKAFLAFFDAIIAGRRGRVAEEHAAVISAAEQFAQLEWHGYADMAKEMLDPTSIRRTDRVLPVLTSRERQVAGLVSKGLTNREIAIGLSITENTVETHMASIMNRCGIRSRHQLVDLLNAG